MKGDCYIENSSKAAKKYYSYTRYNLFKKDSTLANAYKGYVSVVDRINANISRYSEAMGDFEKKRNTMGESDKIVFVEKFRGIVRHAKELAMNNGTSVDISEIINRLSTEMVTPYMKSGEFLNQISILQEVMEGNVDMFKVLANISPKRGLIDVFENLANSLKYEILSIPGMKYSDMGEKLKVILERNGIKDTEAKNIIKDILGGPLGEGFLRRLSGNLRQLYTTIKFGPLTGLLGGTILLLNNVALGTINLIGKRRGLEDLLKHDLIEGLIKGDENYSGILRNHSREIALSRENLSINGKNAIYRFTNMILDKIPFMGDGAKKKLEAIMLSGIHTIRDFAAQNDVVKTSIAQSLAKNGIHGKNVDAFRKAYNAKLIDTKFVDQIRADAHMYYQRFFTSSNLLALNRHSFSRRWMFTNLQNYVTVRADEMYTSIRDAYGLWRRGGLRTRGDFVDYINTDNQELKSLLNNILLSAKMSVYMNHMLNGNEVEENSKQTRQYFLGMSEYLSSLDAQFFFRLITSPLSGVSKYYKYTEATGKEEEFMEGIQVSFLHTLSNTMSMLFREGKVLDIMIDPMIAFMKTGDIDFSSDVAGVAFDKLASGMGRFMLIPGEDTFGQKSLIEDDDFIGRILMNFDRTNELAGISRDFRGIGDSENILNNPQNFLLRTFQYLPVLGKWLGLGNDKIGWNESKYNLLKDIVENDSTMKQIWNGELPQDLLMNENILDNLYRELTEFQYYNKKYIGDGKHEVSKYGLATMKEDVFIENIANKIYGSTEAMDAVLFGEKANKKDLIKALAAAEANTPGSSRIVLSYLANKELKGLKEQYLGNAYMSSAEIPKDIEDAFKRDIVSKLYPYMYTADKTSRYRLGVSYVEELRPDIFTSLSSDSQLKGFVNSLGYLDFTINQMENKGEFDAKYIKNAFNFGTKYISDEGDRIKVVQHSLATIDSLKNANISQKRLMRAGVLGANIDFFNKIKKDEIMSVVYDKDIKEFENFTRGLVEDINTKGIAGIEGDLDAEARRQYYGSYGSPYKKNQYSDSNRKYVDDLMDKVNRIYNPVVNGVPSYIKPYSANYNSPRDIANLSPKRYRIYVKFYEEQYRAYTKALVTAREKRYPAEFLETLKFSVPSYNKGTIKAPEPIKFKQPRKKRVSTKTDRQFPGSTDDLSVD